MPSGDVILRAAALAVLLPAAVAAVLTFVGIAVGRWIKVETAPAAGALGLLAGYAAGVLALGFTPTKPLDPSDWDPWDWFAFLAFLAIGVGLVCRWPRASPVLRWALRGAVVLTAAWLLVPDLDDLRAARWYWRAFVAAAVFAYWLVLDLVAGRQPGGLLPALLAFVSVAAGGILEMSGNGTLAQLAGVVVGILAATAILAILLPRRPFLTGLIPGFAVLLPGLLLNGYFRAFGGVPASSFALVLLAPLLLGISLPIPWKGPRLWLTQAGLVLLPIGVALALAAAATDWTAE
jgi:hypothetical protein